MLGQHCYVFFVLMCPLVVPLVMFFFKLSFCQLPLAIFFLRGVEPIMANVIVVLLIMLDSTIAYALQISRELMVQQNADPQSINQV